jgi:TIR domain
MKDFFISYSKGDQAWAEWIALILKEGGYSTVIRAWDIRPGSNFVLEMQQAASTANRTIAVLSEKYLQSAFTESECAAAFAQDPQGKKQKQIPIRIAHSGTPKRDPGLQKRLWNVERRTPKGVSSEGDKKLTRLTRAEQAGWTAFEGVADIMTKALAEEKGPSKSAILLTFLDHWENFIEGVTDEKFSVDHAFDVARLRGEVTKLELLEKAEPMFTVDQVAEVLNRSRQAVHKRLQGGSLFGMMRKGEFRIPAWQIREGEVVPGIAKVLKNLDTTDWGKMLFFHSENAQLEGRRPMDLILEGDADSVAEVAALFGEQGAK